MVVPEIPQLHEGLLGLHIKSTDIDSGSLNGNLVCGPFDVPGAKSALHPSIEFDEPMNFIKVKATAPDGKSVWDASYGMNGKTILPQDAPPNGGIAQQWNKICTGRGVNEAYTISINGNGVKSGDFDTSMTFTSNNALAARTPEVLPIQKLVPPPPRMPPGPIAVRLTPNELNPLTYVKFM